MTHIHSFAAALLCAAIGCADIAEPTGTETQDSDVFQIALERDLLATDIARSHLASYADAITDNAAEDIAYLVPNQLIVSGRRAVASVIAGDPTTARTATFDPRRATVSADGLIGHTFGWNVFGDGTFGKYSTVWRRAPHGWRIVVHVQNPTGFAPSPAPADFPLLDDEHPVIRFAAPRRTAAEIAATDLAFAAASVADGTGPAFPAFADEDAVEIAGPIAYGLAAVIADHADDPPPSEELVDWAPIDAGASLSGDLGWSIGYASFTDVTGVSFSKYLTVWERQPDTTWKWIADMGNGSPAP